MSYLKKVQGKYKAEALIGFGMKEVGEAMEKPFYKEAIPVVQKLVEKHCGKKADVAHTLWALHALLEKTGCPTFE